MGKSGALMSLIGGGFLSLVLSLNSVFLEGVCGFLTLRSMGSGGIEWEDLGWDLSRTSLTIAKTDSLRTHQTKKSIPPTQSRHSASKLQRADKPITGIKIFKFFSIFFQDHSVALYVKNSQKTWSPVPGWPHTSPAC